ncbi:unnamed protein product [Urochloa humidicola]
MSPPPQQPHLGDCGRPLARTGRQPSANPQPADEGRPRRRPSALQWPSQGDVAPPAAIPRPAVEGRPCRQPHPVARRQGAATAAAAVAPAPPVASSALRGPTSTLPPVAICPPHVWPLPPRHGAPPRRPGARDPSGLLRA